MRLKDWIKSQRIQPEFLIGERIRIIGIPVRAKEPIEIICEGVCEGSIAPEQRGDRGFGYDSVFVPAAGDGRTFAQMSVEEKHQYSHRAIAFRLLAKRLGELPAP